MGPLYRSRTERVFTGLAAALARSLGVRPVILRVLFFVLALASGIGLVLYALGTVLVPVEGTRARRYADVPLENLRAVPAELGAAGRAFVRHVRAWNERRVYGARDERLREVVGAGLVVLGLLWFLASLDLFDWLTFGRFLALLLVAAGAGVLALSRPRG